MATGWNHKYPYTNFHELNLDIWLQKMTDLETLVNTFDARITQNTNDITALKGRMTTAEADIANLKPRMTTAEGKIEDLEENVSALNDADIMDAEMLSSVGPANATATNVQIPFVRDTYADGTKGSPSGSQTTTIPAATESAAGVMLPAEKSKLEAFSVDGDGNVTFDGRVSATGPAGSGDLATKQYVDSVVVAGTASVTYQNDIASDSWYTNNVTPDSYSTASGVSARQWGSYTDLTITKQFTFTTDNITEDAQEITHITLQSGYVPSSGFRDQIILVRRTRGGVYDWVPVLLRVNPTGNNSRLQIVNLGGVSWQTGDVMYLFRARISYLL